MRLEVGATRVGLHPGGRIAKGLDPARAQAETQRANAEAELTNARIQLAATKVGALTKAQLSQFIDQQLA